MAVKSTELLNVRRVLAGAGARVVLVYFAALMPALVMAVAQPVWSRVDETQHADVLSQYAHGVVPIEGVTRLQRDIVAVDQATGMYRWYPTGAGPVPGEDDPQTFVAPPPTASTEARTAWMVRHLWGFSYEAMQPPLYYVLAEPDWLLGSRFGGTLGAIYAARIFGALIAACLAPLTYLLALVVRPSAERMALVAAGLAALLPGYVLNATQITNDGLAAVLGAALTLVAVKGARDGWSRSLAAVCGVLLGTAMLAKLTTVGLAPLVMAAFLWPGPQPLRSRVALGAIGAAVAALVVAPWLLFNLHTYGEPVPSRATRAVLGASFHAASATKSYLIPSARNIFDEFVVGEPFGTMPLKRLLVWVMEGLILLGGIGLVLRLRRLRLEWLVLVGAAADVAWVVGTPYLSGIGGLMPGRYLYPAAAAIFVLIAAGIDALPRALTRPVVGAAAATAVVALALLLSSRFGVSEPQRVLPHPTAGVAVAAHGDSVGVQVTADRVWVTDGGLTVWVHVTVTDRADKAADFPPVPDASIGGEWLYADYANSTPFPERLEPGESRSGWVRFTRTEPTTIRQLELTYSYVTTDGYATVGTVSVVVNP